MVDSSLRLHSSLDRIASADWSPIPDHLHHSLRAYLEHGRIPGTFLIAVLANDLAGAIYSANPEALSALRSIITFLSETAPDEAWGTPERLAKWEQRGGLLGKTKPTFPATETQQ